MAQAWAAEVAILTGSEESVLAPTSGSRSGSTPVAILTGSEESVLGDARAVARLAVLVAILTGSEESVLAAHAADGLLPEFLLRSSPAPKSRCWGRREAHREGRSGVAILTGSEESVLGAGALADDLLVRAVAILTGSEESVLASRGTGSAASTSRCDPHRLRRVGAGLAQHGITLTEIQVAILTGSEESVLASGSATW